jgi:hypothetical protein
MASTIQSQTIGSADLCIALAASQFGRAHGCGDNWNTLRVALNYNVETTGASLAGTVLRVGLCKGTANMPGDATTDNSYGIKFQQAWLYLAGPPVRYAQYTTGDPFAFTRVGTTETTSVTNVQPLISAVSSCRCSLFVDIIKGSPNYTFKMLFLSGTAVDVTPAAFLGQISAVTPALTNHTYSSPTGTSLAVNTGLNGVLDTVYVGWNTLTPRIFIGNLAVVRLA